MKRYLLLALMVLSMTGNLLSKDYNIERELNIRPQLKVGKIENGNGFFEMQYVKFRYDFTHKYTLSGGLSTGFTSPRASILSMNHSVNRLGIKFTYRPFDELGFFFEGSLVDNIEGATNPASYFAYDNFQAIGISWDIRTYKFSK